MQYRLQDELVPQATAHLMGRPTESNEGGPIRFRVQADRRREHRLAHGATDRRARRETPAVKDGKANPGHQAVAPPSTDKTWPVT